MHAYIRRKIFLLSSKLSDTFFLRTLDYFGLSQYFSCTYIYFLHKLYIRTKIYIWIKMFKPIAQYFRGVSAETRFVLFGRMNYSYLIIYLSMRFLKGMVFVIVLTIFTNHFFVIRQSEHSNELTTEILKISLATDSCKAKTPTFRHTHNWL